MREETRTEKDHFAFDPAGHPGKARRIRRIDEGVGAVAGEASVGDENLVQILASHALKRIAAEDLECSEFRGSRQRFQCVKLRGLRRIRWVREQIPRDARAGSAPRKRISRSKD